MRNISHKTLDYKLLGHAKKIILTSIAFAAVIFIFFADCLVSKIHLQPSFVEVNEVDSILLQIHKTERTIKSTIRDHVQLYSAHEEIIQTKTQNSLIPPFNVSEDERIQWFREKLPEFKIFNSNDLSQEFHSRVLEFFDGKCELKFFMTWISPAESFTSREFISIETLFRAHPYGCLIILSESLDSEKGYRIFKPLVDRRFKVTAIKPDLAFLVKNTPAETWFQEMKNGYKDPGEIPLPQNLSNLLRLLVLYKYGGIYLDTDFIVLKSFAGLRNSIGAQSVDAVSKNWTRLNNAALIFDREHPVLFKFIEEFAATFDGNKWGHNGPYLVSRVAQKISGRPGFDFTVLQPMAFYPVGWIRISGLFKKPEESAEFRWVNAKLLQLRGDTYAVHLWNKQSSRIQIEEGSVMARLISHHCVICEYLHSSF